MKYILWCAIGYASGAVMYAYLIPLLLEKKNIVKLSEDKNPGAANVFSNCKISTSMIVLILELLKGALPIYFAAKSLDVQTVAFAAVIASPVAGHAFPPKIAGIRGGKAIAVSFGVTIGLFPVLMPLIILAGLYLFFSLAIVIKPHRTRSIVTFACFAVLSAVLVRPLPIAAGCAAASLIVIVKHIVSAADKSTSVSLFGISGK